MHACGHDVHASWAVAAAYLLSQNPAAGDVLIVLQPAEETGGGAISILKSGALEDVSAIFGGHVNRDFGVGKIMVDEGPIGASADEFSIMLRGRGAHGARPHQSNDPIIGMAALINALQTVISRRKNPARPGVISIGTVRAGSATNIIPDKVELTGTLRATDHGTRELLQGELRRTANKIAAVYRLKAETSFLEGSPPLINSALPTQWASRAVVALLGEKALVHQESPSMGGEDFAAYLEKIPGCYLRVGAREPGGKNIAAHTPHYYAAAECIFIGGAVLAETARFASEALNK
jgi:hippurate hydrolase